MTADWSGRRRMPARPSVPLAVLWGYGALALLLAGYVASQVVRPVGETLPLLDNWLVAGFELVVAGLCILRGLTDRRTRAVPLVLGCALLSWTLGDILLAVESASGATVPTPAPDDALYLCFYPIAYAALLLLMRREVGHIRAATLLDGIVAGLGTAAVCASFVVPMLLQSVRGTPLAVATQLVYPVGDLLLLALAVGGTALLPVRNKAKWLLPAGGLAFNAIGDTANLFHDSFGATRVGLVFNAIAWPTAILLTSFSVWLPPGRSDPRVRAREPGFILPGLAALAGLAILFVASRRDVNGVALGLAGATLLAVGVRLALTDRMLRGLTELRRRQAVTDELTGIGNRRHLFDVLDRFFTERDDSEPPGRSVAFLYMDLDHFKEINDSFGHTAGDEVLRQLGPRLAGALRGSDVLVRIGGDELGVVLLDADTSEARDVAQRLLATLDDPFVLDEVTVRVHASIGVALASNTVPDAAALVRNADAAMYRAKVEGSAVAVHSVEQDVAGDRLRLADELRAAIASSQLAVHYQPLLNIRDDRVEGVEALLRWPHPRLGTVSPMEFLPLAEEAGLMPALTAWVLDQALAQCAVWRSHGQDIAVSVNISATDVQWAGFVDIVDAGLRRHGVPADSLTLEMTETTIIRHFERCIDGITALRDLGVGVSVDDFGAGFTSLAYLSKLSFSELKLDRTLIIGMASDSRTYDLVRATVGLGHALGLHIVAEGIEDAATLEMLRATGCDVAQGYYIGRPAPAAALSRITMNNAEDANARAS